ncbi:PBSX family phage terminase large subunit [Pontibacter saemangeumensis]|uniref:PBSX family phage terminase large subunit n=1 Tax=Pontibacter saemangeumensis TaxID=1084525 RepID=A0ABP8LT44_9BACT
MFACGPLFQVNNSAEEKVLVNQGGTSSGKTYTIMQLLYDWAIRYPRFVITVIGESIPNLKKGAYRDAETIYALTPELEHYIKSWNRTERIIYFRNGSIIEFTSFETEQGAKNGKRDVAFFNEANGIIYQIYWQVARRTRHKVILDYNPTAEFWAHEKVIGKPNTRLIISDHRHNLWLTPEQHQEIEDIRLEDEELWKVYARGLTGKIEGLVYRKWRVVEEIPEGAKYIGTGLDFGFTNDPTGAVDVYEQDGELWWDELLYEPGLTNQDIGKRLDELGFSRRKELIADSSEPKSIEEIRRLGFRIEAAKKGPDSVNNGIDVLKRYWVNVTRRSTNLRKELSSYKWKVDRATGLATNEPIDKFNHLLDPARYVALNKLALVPTKKVKGRILKR